MSAEAAVAAGSPKLAELEERFVLHWGEMASAWGINRTMGQIHGLLYISPQPLSMDEIMQRLKISRGNASMSLRALEDWGVIQRVHAPPAGCWASSSARSRSLGSRCPGRRSSP